MNCARCDKPLTGAHDTITNPGASGSGGDVPVCPVYCKSKPRQTAPLGATLVAEGGHPDARYGWPQARRREAPLAPAAGPQRTRSDSGMLRASAMSSNSVRSGAR